MSTETAVKAKKRFKLTKNWIVMIVLVALIALTVCSCVTVQAVTKNPGAAVLDTYISAAKSQNVKKMAGAFYKKGSDEYKKFVDDYNTGKKEYKSFSSSAGEQEKDAFGATSENLNNEARDRGLRLYWESRLAKNIKDYDYTILVEDKDQITMSIVLDSKSAISTKEMPKKYNNYLANGVSTKFTIRFSRDASSKKWYFSADFRFINGQRDVATWFAPYGDGKREVKKVNNNDISTDNGEYRLASDVVSIGTRAFENCTALKKLIVSNDLVNIGAYAFDGCKNLVEIVYENGTKINADSPVVLGEGAFYNCEKFEDASARTGAAFEIPKINKTIPNYLFYNNKTFSGTAGVVALPQDIITVGHYAFYGCAAITSVSIPATVATIGDSAFDGCTKLVTFAENNVISDNVTRIGSNAFRGCAAITSVSLPDNLLDLGTGIFNGCTSLATVKLPKNLKSLGNNLFLGTAIKSMQIPSTVEKIGNFAFAESAITEIEWLVNDKQKTAIRTIGENAFNNCKALTKIVLPESIKGIGTSAFVGCTAMRSVMVDFQSSAVVGESAFEMSDGIPKVYVHDNELVGFRQKWFNMGLDMYSQKILTADKKFAIVEETRKDGAGNDITEKVLVQYLGEEEMVTLDPTITRLGNGAFAHSANLKGIENFDSLNLNDIALNVFSGCANMVYNTFGSYEDFKYLGKWLVDGNNFVAGDLDLVSGKYPEQPDTVGIAAGAFSKVKTAIESVRISKGVKYISENAFMQSNKLSVVIFENDSQLERLGDGVFYSCGSLDNIILPSSLKEMGERVFQYCDMLRYAVISSGSNVVMGTDAFSINYGLPKIYVGGLEGNEFYVETAKVIAGSHNERSEDSVKEWSAKVAAIQSCMFDTKYIHESGDYAVAMQSWTAADGTQHEFKTLIQLFSTGLTEFDIPDDITRIGVAAFAKSTVEEVNVSSNVKRVEEYAFYDCDSLTSVVFAAKEGKDSLEYLGTHAFRGCKLISENAAARVTFNADAPHANFTTGEAPFDTESVTRKIGVQTRDNYEKNAYWAANRLILDAEDDPWIEIEIKIQEAGTNGTPNNIVTSGIGRFENAPGEIISSTATPDKENGYEFAAWYLGDIKLTEDGEDGITIKYSEDTKGNKYTAVFTRKMALANIKIDGITADGEAGGSIYRDEALTNKVITSKGTDGIKGSFLTDTNKTFTLYADANPEFDFVGWFTVEDEVETPLGTNVKQDFSMAYADKDIVAKFNQVRAWAVISKPSGGDIAIVSTHGEGDINETSNEIRVLLEIDEEVTIEIKNVDDFWVFKGWTVGSNQTPAGSDTTATFKLDVIGNPTNKIIRPVFEKIKVDVTVTFNSAQGSITRTDSGLNDKVTSGVTMQITHGSFTLTAEAKTGFVFKCWKKDGVEVPNMGESYRVTMIGDEPINIVAEFEPEA